MKEERLIVAYNCRLFALSTWGFGCVYFGRSLYWLGLHLLSAGSDRFKLIIRIVKTMEQQ